MSFIDTYFAVLEKLESKIKAMTDESGNKLFDQVITGRKEAPTRYPAVIITPETVEMTAATTAYTERAITFTITVVGKKANVREGLEEAARLAWKIAEMLEQDRSFEKTVDRLEIISFNPEVERPRVVDRHEANVVVTFYKIC